MKTNENQACEHGDSVFPDSDNQRLYELNNRYSCTCDESKMYNRFMVPVKAEGMWVWGMNDDEPYLDLIMGYSSINFGHKCPEIEKIVIEALESVVHIHSFHTQSQIELSYYLSRKLSEEFIYKVYYNLGGSNVVCDAIRLCRQFTGRQKIVTFDGAYHGSNYASGAVTDDSFLNPDQYGNNPLKKDVVRVPFPNMNRGINTDFCIDKLEEALKSSDKPAGLIIEPVQGANGFIIPDNQFIRAVRELTLKYDVVMVDDEIQVGVGRAGYLYSIHNWGVTPDIALLSKSLAGSYYPLSAVIAKEEIFNAVSPKRTAFQATFNNSPIGTYIALRTLEYAEKNSIFENVKPLGELLLDQLSFLNEISWIDNLRGIGLAIAFDVIDKTTKQPDRVLAKEFVEYAFYNHILIYPSGVNQNVIKIAPPLNITKQDIEKIVNCLKRCIYKFNRDS
ncbi:aspartate aminotransferase family protein [Ruminiclostridium josui]|uniref:class-III pyridoxal-phosphate-dependent aminotransferase n=1 Tax=Ruminiclostridium josui TaxID=1499 RepID=UPI000463144E|nr:aspartate aminotransferase family protein [Ruminiclostridium josui]